jgi:uncharacterized protein
MNVTELKESGRIIYEVTSGSHAYGTNVATSDRDIRGFYWSPMKDYAGLIPVKEQVNDEKNDIVYYDLKRAFELLKTANPNMIELLWIPEDCVHTFQHPIMTIMMNNKKLFISKKAYFTHAEYAYAQIKKAKGQNKKVHNPCPETMPQKEDFCWVIDMEDINNLPKEFMSSVVNDWFEDIRDEIDENKFPFRPILLKNSGLNLSHYHVAALEHVPNTYRMYYYGEGAKGVFRGDQMLCCESIPKDDEKKKFQGLLIYNQVEFERALADWRSYWDWMKNRNESRWIDQEKGLLNYDQKNMMHCVRLMLSAENILKEGEPLVRFTGDLQKYLLKIRRGEFTYDEIMKDVNEKEASLKKLFETSKVPEHVDMEKINKLFMGMVEVGHIDVNSKFEKFEKFEFGFRPIKAMH